MKFDLVVRQVGDDVEGIRKITLEGKDGNIYLDEPVKLFSLSQGDKIMLSVNEEGDGFFSASYLPVYQKEVEGRRTALYSAYGLLIRFEGNFKVPNEKIKITLSKPSSN